MIRGNDFTHERLGLTNHAKDCTLAVEENIEIDMINATH